MKIKTLVAALASVVLCGTLSCKKESKLYIRFPERFEGKTVEIIDYCDSTVVNTGIVTNGEVVFIDTPTDGREFPRFMQASVDGRICAFFIAEPGTAIVTDSTNVATGTPLNNRFAALMVKLDSIENLDDLSLYVRFVEDRYNENKGNPMGDYFGIEWLKYADPQSVDSLLAEAPTDFRESRRVKHFENFAKHRLLTSPGHKYVDIDGETADGKPVRMSQFMGASAGKYTVVDIWASWCPYCIRELPDLKQLRADMGDMVEIVGVAVRDLPADTRAMVEKQEIPWPVLYNTERRPYDIYGFSGIPHHILIAPDGTIESRGENVAQIRSRLEKIKNENAD